MAKKTASKKSSSKGEIEIPNLPTVRAFGSVLPIVPSAEKGQITEICVETGVPGTKDCKSIPVYHNRDFASGIHPSQAEFVFNVVIGALGSGRGERPLGFSSWVHDVVGKFSTQPWLKNLLKYNVVVNYSKRGGMMQYSMEDLVNLCQIKFNAGTASYKRWPREKSVRELKSSGELQRVHVTTTL
ncbi:hypothetical protein MUP59_05540 [Candidatus Bathyarchaeota archaeon]|nr:hypothetical protein [Candidatus Bathyarchaeota archaeon]